jgi:hypothetical protein
VVARFVQVAEKELDRTGATAAVASARACVRPSDEPLAGQPIILPMVVTLIQIKLMPRQRR